MKLSIIKADIGGIGGHIKPSERLIDGVGRIYKRQYRWDVQGDFPATGE
ncbi:MAG: fructose 1,6-bisphosphatase, partial [Deltaproteobacteria bacterium]|nr:fructose 1,6-bisphosphatase [Deltaproteobacteria bacterium]